MRMKTIKLLPIFVGLFSFAHLQAQEIFARVQILSPMVQTANKNALDQLGKSVTDFLNTRNWTGHQVRPNERIECSLVINILEWDGASNYSAEAQIISNRPVYNSAYNSPVLSISDKDFNFNYNEGDPLDFADNQFIGNLQSLLAYYAYIIIGLDADTFSIEAGTPYFLKAQEIVNNAQNSSFTGWKPLDGLRNRYWLMNNLLDPNYLPIRTFSYEYHIDGLDKLADKPSEARNTIGQLLPSLHKVDRLAQGAMYNQLFFTAKSEELAAVLSGLSPTERLKAINILMEIDPGNINKYEAIRKL